MVRCTKCGTDNKEDARFCVQCGASLYPVRAREEKYEKHEKSERDMCFGPARAGGYFWLFIGLLVLLWGVIQLLEIIFRISINMGPIILIAIGLYIIYRVLSRLGRL